MKLTNKNYDIADFELSRLSRLLIILQVYSVGNSELQMGFKGSLIGLSKLWIQHYFCTDNIIVNRFVVILRRILNFMRQLVVKLKRD